MYTAKVIENDICLMKVLKDAERLNKMPRLSPSAIYIGQTMHQLK